MQKQAIIHFLYAGALGDALGVPVEFRRRDTYHVDTMTGYGTWEQPAGTWSDDTSMTLALVDNLTADADNDALFKKFVAYMQDGAYTPFGHLFDIGNTCAKAIRTYAKGGTEPTQCGDPSEFANGNGAVMRLAPLAITLLNEDDPAVRFAQYRDYTSFTHRHPRAILGTALYLEALRHLLQGANLTEALNRAHAFAAQLPGQYQNELKAYHRIFDPQFARIPRAGIESSGYVVDTLEAAFWCALNARNWRDGVLAAANLGSDADTGASITATILAAARPADQFPDDWQSALKNSAMLARYFTPFAERYQATA